MTDKPGHSKNKPDHEVFEHFTDHEKKDVERIWNVSGRIEKEDPGLTDNEIEEALQKVHSRLDKNEDMNSSNVRWRWIAAAAVILLVFGAGILLMPQTTTAPYGEIISHRLPDGSTVELNSGSSLRYNRLFTYTHRSVRLEGEAFFSVENGGHPFTVHTGNSTVEVTGTEFNVRSWDDEPGGKTEVTVSEGTVHFFEESRRDSAVKIKPGYISRLAPGMAKPTLPEPVSIERVMGWRDNMLIFSDKSLLVIFRELERRFDVEIRLEDDAVAHETLSAYYEEPKGVESVLKDICRVKGLRYSETANGYRVYN